METTDARVHRESGQTLILFVLALMVLLGFVAMTIDVGLAFMERRSLQNAVDSAALAAAQDFVNGASADTAEATAIDYLQRHGFAAPVDTVEVNIPPTSGQYAGVSGYVEVKASSEAPPAFVLLFLDDPYTLSARSVAEGAPATTSTSSAPGGGAPPPPAPVPSNLACGGPTVDGRVTTGDGYTKVGDLGTAGTDYGDVFVACDDNFYYFAMRLNGPDTGGPVGNDNVYMCRTPIECVAGDNPNYHDEYQTGWTLDGRTRHSFRDLLKTDRARFQISCGQTTLHDFILDYLIETGVPANNWKSDASGEGTVYKNAPTDSASSLEWNLEHPEETGWGDDPDEHPQTQSPPFNPAWPTYDSEYDGWIWEMIYEFKVPKQPLANCDSTVLFGLYDFAGSTGGLGGIHSSPAKTADAVFIHVVAQEGVLKLVE